MWVHLVAGVHNRCQREIKNQKPSLSVPRLMIWLSKRCAWWGLVTSLPFLLYCVPTIQGQGRRGSQGLATLVNTDNEEEPPVDVDLPEHEKAIKGHRVTCEGSTQGSLLDEGWETLYIPQPYASMLQWSDMAGTSSGRSAFTSVA